MGKRIVIALGGNALGKNLPEQMEAVQHTARAIVDLIEQGNEVIVVHGNGPQVGMIANAMTELTRSDPQKYIPCPLSVCGAMSQGYIGYDLQNALREEMERRGITRGVATVLTQVEVDPEDPAFKNPTKPIGSFMTEDEAEQLKRDRGYDFVEDSGRGYRAASSSWTPSPPSSRPTMWSSPAVAAASRCCPPATTTSRAPLPSSTRTLPRSFWPSPWTPTTS